jgi:hypothetical protein
MNYTITNPKGIDFPIQKIQNYLFDKLNWGDIAVYGRVHKNPSGQKGILLEAYIGHNEYKDVFTDDTKNATIFFVEDDVHNSKEGIRFTTKIKIVFMVNLSKTFPSILHRADMEAEMTAIEIIRKRSGFSFEKLEKGIKQCLGEFYTEGIKLNDMHPYHTFSITGEITYQISC